MNLTQRTVQSSIWNFAVNILQLGLTFVRSVLLARWLDVDLFGIYAYAASIVALTQIIPRFGMDGAFINRVPETEDEGQTAAVHFTLITLFSSIWALILWGGGAFAFNQQTYIPLAVLVLAGLISQLTWTPRLILIRRVTHQRLAGISLISAFFSTIISLILARLGAGIWALLSMDLAGAAMNIIGFYLWRSVWKPEFTWRPREIKYFLSFGRKTLLAVILSNALDRLDDIWTGFFLGDRPLAFYSKAYSFAEMPGKIIGSQIDSVIRGSYAELKEKRVSLSKGFSLANEIMIRSGFFLGGLLFLASPELIAILLGEKWLPMLIPFQLMLVYTLLNPVKASVGGLFIAVGRPELILRARAIQLVVMLAGIFVLGFQYGIVGVAVAVDIMLLLGLVLQLLLSKEFVDFSWKSLFLTPGLALLGGLLLYALLSVWVQPGSGWLVVFFKTAVFSLGYFSLYLLMEYDRLSKVYLPLILGAVGKSPDRDPGQGKNP